jgi:putative spermidine/putrescine transport system permease protein
MGAQPRRAGRRVSGAPRWLRLLLLAALALGAVGPLVLLVVVSLGREWFFPALLPAAWTAESWTALQQGGRLAGAALSSLLLATGAGLIACVAGLPIGRALARLDGWRRHLGAAAAFLPVAAPPLALGTGLELTFLRLGLGGSYFGVLLAHAVPAVGYASLFFLGVFTLFDARIEEEARSLGATPRDVFVRVTLPMLRRPIAEAFALGFLVSWAQVPLTLLIGGGAVRTLPLEVFAFVQAGQDRFAATGALLLVIPALLALAAAALAARTTDVAAV